MRIGSDVVLLVSAGVVFFVLGQIWFCQIVIYPLFAKVGSAEYPAYHRFYARRIPVPVIMPGFASFLLPMVLLWTRPELVPAWATILNAACGLVGLILTVGFLIPRHLTLERHGKDESVIRALVRYNWARTVSITASAALTLLMALAAFAPGIRGDDRSSAPKPYKRLPSPRCSGRTKNAPTSAVSIVRK